MAGVLLRHSSMSAHNPRAILYIPFMLVSFVFLVFHMDHPSFKGRFNGILVYPSHVYCNGPSQDEKNGVVFKHVPKIVSRLLGCFPRNILKHGMVFGEHPKDF